MFSREEIQAANERAAQRLRDEPHVEKAHYDPKLGRVIVTLSNHAWFAFRPEDAQGLEGATTSQLKQIEITPSTFGIHFPMLDAYMDIGALMHGHFGTKAWMAQRMGAAGGSVRSKAKSVAAKANGKLGGRPRKAVAS
jgi:xanthine dehydrogenase molybdopterin-binding subunit B